MGLSHPAQCTIVFGWLIWGEPGMDPGDSPLSRMMTEMGSQSPWMQAAKAGWRVQLVQ